jgi:predicted MPP superfamily phosphohydrolase
MSSARDGEHTAQISCPRRAPWFAFGPAAPFEWTKIRLSIPNLHPELDGLRFIHLSDLHTRTSWPRAYDRLIEQVQAANPDLLLITGDFIDNKFDHRPALPILKRLLPRLSARLGVWAILGNHDVDIISPYLAAMGINLIDGRRAEMTSPSGAKLELIGLPGVARTDMDADFIASIPPKSPDSLRIILSHFPDHIRRTRPLQPDIFLAGHTHGGQCCLPGGRPLLTHDSLPRPLAKGVHRIHQSWLIVSRGIGYAGLPLRLFCPAEVAEITVTRSNL